MPRGLGGVVLFGIHSGSNVARDLPGLSSELQPIVTIWGDQRQNKSVLYRCDNLAADSLMQPVHIINSGTCSDAQVMALLRCLHFITNIMFSEVHLPGVENNLADALSRDIMLTSFYKIHRYHPIHPVPLEDVLTSANMDWMSPCWNSMFSNIFRRDCQRAPSTPTPQLTESPHFFSKYTTQPV